jgi:hypothetical protein
MDSMEIPKILLTDGDHDLSFRKSLFWDVPVKDLNLMTHRRLIIERVFARGNLDEYIQLVNYYSEQEIKKVIIRVETFDKKTLNFISSTYNINPKELNASKGISR